MTELIPGVELDFEIAKAVGLEPLGIYTGWAPDGSWGWYENSDDKRVVVLDSHFYKEWYHLGEFNENNCGHIHEFYSKEDLTQPYYNTQRLFYEQFGHYKHCCAPAPEYSVDLNAALEAARKIGLFNQVFAEIQGWSGGFTVCVKTTNPSDGNTIIIYLTDKPRETLSLAICEAILNFTKIEKISINGQQCIRVMPNETK